MAKGEYHEVCKELFAAGYYTGKVTIEVFLGRDGSQGTCAGNSGDQISPPARRQLHRTSLRLLGARRHGRVRKTARRGRARRREDSGDAGPGCKTPAHPNARRPPGEPEELCAAGSAKKKLI